MNQTAVDNPHKEKPVKTLLILRHAKSDWGNSQMSDHDRPLNDRGKYDAPRMMRDFYLASPPEYIEVLNELPGSYERVMIVGHNPGMEEMVALLTDQERPFTTANVAVIELPISSWGELSIFTDGRLKHHWRPKDLPA